MHLIFPANSCSSAFSARRLSPKISRLSKTSFSVTRRFAWYDRSGSSRRTRGSSRGRVSFPIQVSSSLVFVRSVIMTWGNLLRQGSHDLPTDREEPFRFDPLSELGLHLRNQSLLAPVDIVLGIVEAAASKCTLGLQVLYFSMKLDFSL